MVYSIIQKSQLEGEYQLGAELVRKSHEARKRSKKLLEEAKRKVEEMINRGSD